MSRSLYWFFIALISFAVLATGCINRTEEGSKQEAYFDQVRAESSYPLTNYCFSKDKRDALIENAQSVLNQSRLTMGNAIYRFRYSHPRVIKQGKSQVKVLLFLLENTQNSNDQLALLLPVNPDERSVCRLFSRQQAKEYQYQCTKADFIEQGESLYLHAAFLPEASDRYEHSPWTMDLLIQDKRRIMQLGSVQYSMQVFQDMTANIGMRNPFSAFPKAFCPNGLILGSTSFIELSQTIEWLTRQGFDIQWLVFGESLLGSIGEGLNMYSGLMIRDRGISTRLKVDRRIASGGTHLFISGKRRMIELKHPNEDIARSRRVGVHSWQGQGRQSKSMLSARLLPLRHEAHSEQATFYQRMLGDIGRSFYLFTLKAAAPNEMHYVNREEASLNRLITDFVSPNTL
jgi:hypothetical protein